MIFEDERCNKDSDGHYIYTLDRNGFLDVTSLSHSDNSIESWCNNDGHIEIEVEDAKSHTKIVKYWFLSCNEGPMNSKNVDGHQKSCLHKKAIQLALFCMHLEELVES